MLAYIIRRVLYMIPTILAVALLVFLLFHEVGEDPVRVALGPHASPEKIAALEAKWGLDQPMHMQFGKFLKEIGTMDFGRSYVTDEKLSGLFAEGAWVSLSLTAPPFILGLLLNVALSLLIAFYRGSWFDRLSTAIFIISMSISYLVYIIGFQYLFAFQLDWFPINGYSWGVSSIPYLTLPILIMLFVRAGPEIRLYRTVFLDETSEDYVRTARAKGLSENTILFKHILKNAMIPILTNTVTAIPFLVLGAFLMERFFSLPGVGDLMITAINTGDFPVLKGLCMFIAIGYSVFMLLTDILYAYVDPRVKLG